MQFGKQDKNWTCFTKNASSY